jgi:hypothetical protein
LCRRKRLHSRPRNCNPRHSVSAEADRDTIRFSQAESAVKLSPNATIFGFAATHFSAARAALNQRRSAPRFSRCSRAKRADRGQN